VERAPREVWKGMLAMSRGLWPVAAIAGIALFACASLTGCGDESEKSVNDPVTPGLSQGQANKKKGEEFLATNAKKEGVKTLPSGLQYLVLKEGTGKRPEATDQVEVHYHGTLLDGTVFNSSVDRGTPLTIPVNGVIPGWIEALQLMKEGAKWKVFIPSKLAYQKRGSPPKIGPNETLIFEIELLHVK
jgi:FKBP-type peptidyl-prolyl cis-trans isomerase FklB